jgi:hypothetical protein
VLRPSVIGRYFSPAPRELLGGATHILLRHLGEYQIRDGGRH